MITNMQSILCLLKKVEYNYSNHEKYIKMMQDLYDRMESINFLEEFVECLLSAFMMPFNPKNHYVKRILEFCAIFAISLETDEEDDNQFLKELFYTFSKYHDVTVTEVRYHVCEFVNILLKHLGEDALLDDEVCDHIGNVMLDRILDVKPTVRLQAIIALQRLQNPSDPDDLIIKAYIDCLADTNAQIRKALVQCMAPSIQTLPYLIKRCLDIDDKVRMAVYEKFSKLPVKYLKLEQRQFLLRNGFREKSKKILNFFANEFIPRWLTYFNGNCAQFFEALVLDSDEGELKQSMDLIENILNVLFRLKSLQELMEVLNLGPDKLIPIKDLTWHMVVYWRHFLNYLRSQTETEDYIEQIQPELLQFTNYIEGYYTILKNTTNDWEFELKNAILSEMFKIASNYDLSDEVGRRAIHKLIINIFNEVSVNEKSLTEMMLIYEKLVPNVVTRTAEICSIISDIREPMVHYEPTEAERRKFTLEEARLKVDLNIMNGEQEDAISKQNFEQAAVLKTKIATIKEQMQALTLEFEKQSSRVRAKRNDAFTLCKCLDLLTVLLQAPDIKEFTTSLRSTMDEFVKTLLVSTHPDVYTRAMKCYSLFCYLDKTLAMDSLQVFCWPLLAYRHMAPYNIKNLLIAMGTVVDLIMLYGTEVFGDNILNSTSENISKKKFRLRNVTDSSELEENLSSIPKSASLADVLEILSDMLDDEHIKIREDATNYIVKLLSNGLIAVPALFSKLVLKWFNPATAKDNKIRQMIGSLFSDYVFTVDGSLEVIEQAFLPTLKAIANAPKNSPLTDVDIDSMVKFLVELSRPGRHINNEGLDTHKHLSIQLCNEICQKPNNKFVTIYLRALLMLDVPNDDDLTKEELRKQAVVMLELVQEKLQQKLIEKYIKKMDCVLYEETEPNIELTTTTASNSIIPINNQHISTESHTTEMSVNQSIQNQKNGVGISVKRKKRGHSSRSKTILNLTPVEENDNENNSFDNDNFTIETPTSESSSSKDQLTVTVSTTDSDSDKSSSIPDIPRKKPLRRSLRRK